MNIITDFRNLRPLLEVEGRAELLSTCYKSVFCLPAVDALQKEASSPKEAQANVELFRETLQSLRRLLETLVVEKPTRTWYCLELLDTWLNSQKDNERERAMWCTACILGFTAKMNNFERREGRNRVCGKKRARAKSIVPTCSTTTSVRLPRTNLALWKAFGTQRETTINVLQLLIDILEKLHSRRETRKMAFQPVVVACALCEMLSGSLCQEAVQELCPRLLLAVLCHLYWVIEQNVPTKIVVYSKEGGPGGKRKPFDPTSSWKSEERSCGRCPVFGPHYPEEN
ncbi:uncharacterized protein [Equus caballus]|uniref:uncharacterized protein isoform X2 n=1 Tax=Equus caballus TaxID=9796 RepID=UPI0038B2481A